MVPLEDMLSVETFEALAERSLPKVAWDYYRSGAAGTAVRTLLHWVRSL